MGILYDCMVPSKSFTIETLFDFKRCLNKKFNNLYEKHSSKDTILSESLKERWGVVLSSFKVCKERCEV